MYLVEFNIIVLLCVYTLSAYDIGAENSFIVKDQNYIITEIVEHFIEQPLDHFNEKDNRTWQMRYFERLDLWKAGGPIYLYICGERDANKTVVFVEEFMYSLAKETNAAIFISEHRYYGSSLPFYNMTTAHLAYLSSRQALADLATLLKYIKSSPQYNSSKIVVIGGSYAGNLATWMRLIYPDLVDAAVASSAPVLAKADFYEYLETVGSDFKQYGTPGCYNKIEEIFKRYDTLLKTSAGINQLKKEENICENTDMTKQENKAIFFYAKAFKYMRFAQYRNPTCIRNMCKNLKDTNSFEKPVKSLHKHFSLLHFEVWREDLGCSHYDIDYVVERAENSFKAWSYQTCTEFGYFQSSSSDKQPFTNNIRVEVFYQICTKMFGPDFNEERVVRGVKNTNDMYGGLKPNVSKVVFVNGDMDPWHRLGILEDLSDSAPARLMHGTSHCADLHPEKCDDPDELNETRKYVKKLIKKWIGK